MRPVPGEDLNIFYVMNSENRFSGWFLGAVALWAAIQMVTSLLGRTYTRVLVAESEARLNRQVEALRDLSNCQRWTLDQTTREHRDRVASVASELGSWKAADLNLLDRLVRAERELARLSQSIDGPAAAKEAELNDLKGRVGQ